MSNEQVINSLRKVIADVQAAVNDGSPYLTTTVAKSLMVDAIEALQGLEKLTDPNTLHANLLRGTPAKLTEAHLKHLLGTPAACQVPPEGWECSRSPGHDGPCAARPTERQQRTANAVIQAVINEKNRLNEALNLACSHLSDEQFVAVKAAMPDKVEFRTSEFLQNAVDAITHLLIVHERRDHWGAHMIARHMAENGVSDAYHPTFHKPPLKKEDFSELDDPDQALWESFEVWWAEREFAPETSATLKAQLKMSAWGAVLDFSTVKRARRKMTDAEIYLVAGERVAKKVIAGLDITPEDWIQFARDIEAWEPAR